MKNRSRKTILAELQEAAGNTPVKGSDIEKQKTRLSRSEILSGLQSMAQGGEKTRSAINDAYQARTAQRKNLRAERYNNLVKDYQALFDENKKLRTDKADLKTVAGLLSRADALYKERTSETENSLKAMQESLRSIQAGNMVSWVLPDSWERVIQYAEERTSGNQSSTSDILRDRPDQVSKWAQMEANAYQQKLDAYRETDYDWTDNQSRETYRSTVQKLQDKIDEANEKRDLARSVDSNLRAAEIQARIAENPANFMRWARMEADAYQKKLDETEYDWTDNQSREAYNALNQQWHDKIDAANALHDYAQATMLEQEAAAYTGEITAPQNPGKLYRQVNDKTRWASNQTRQQQPEGNRGADSPDAFMSETQRNTFNYLAGVKGDDAAEAYYELIKPQLEAARSANTAEELEAITKEHPYLATVSSVLMTPLKIPAGLASVAKSSFGVELNQNDSMHQVVHAQNAIRQTAPEVTNWTGDATIFGQDADAFLYGTITSALDSALNMAIAGAITGAAGAAVGGFTAEQATSITSNLVSALMGAEMLPDTIMQEKAKGRSDSEAVALGIIRSTVEGITEKYSVEAFLGDPRGVAKRLEKAFVAEGSEEVASNWLNRIVDIAVKDPDNLKAQYDRLKESGASSGDALTQVIFGAMEEDAGSFLAGGISGLAMGGAAELVDYNRRISAEEYSRLVEAAQLPGAPENTAAEPEVQAEKPAEAPAEAAVEEKPAAAVTVREQRTVETGEAAEETTVEATEQENPVTLDEASKKYGAQAGAMVHTYQPGQDVAAYDRAYEIAYEMGRSGVNRDYAMTSGSTTYLTETQRELAYEAGQASGRQRLRETGMARMGNGTVTMQDGAKDAKLNARQKASVQFLRDLAKITGIDFVVYQSEADGNGNLQGANGYYRNGTVHVDLNAGAMKEGELERAAMLRTVSHEMTHYIAETAPKEYQALQTFLLDKLSGMQDGSLEDLTERKLARAKAAGHPISYGQALEEVVADGCEMMLRDSEAVRTLAKENRGLFETVKDWLSKFLDNLRKAFSGVDAAHQESRYLMENYAKELQELWDAGLTEAVQHTKLENKSVSMSEINEEKADKNSERDYSYEALTSKPDMNVTLVDDTAPRNRADVVYQAKQNAAKIGRFDPKTGSVSVHVNDIDTDVVLATNGLKHSLDRRLGVNAAVVANAGEIIQNSIRINEMTAQKNEAESSYVLIGAARNENGDMYIVRSVVNRFSNELTSLDVLYAINAKKELAALNAPRLGATPLSETNSFNGNQAGDYPQGSRSDDRFLTGSVEPAALNAPGVLTPRYQSTISISKLLDYVNRYFPDILPESVLRHYGHDARPEGKLGESALYQERDADITDADILEHATLRAAENDWEREALREYQRTLGDAQNIQQEWDRQTELAETAKDRDAAIAARNRADIRQRQYERAQDRLRKLQEGAALQAFLRREQAYVQGRQDYETAAERQPGRYSDRFEERLDRGYQVSREVAERYAALNQTYGSIESGENPVRDIEVPRRTGKDNRVSQTVRTAMEAGATNEETVGALMEAVTEGNFSYLPITDKKAKAWAEEYIQERTWEEAAGDLQKTMGKGRLGKKDVALGFHLYNHYVQEGQTKEAVRLLVDLSERIREGAQAVQAVRMLKQLSPDHQVYALTQSIHSLQKELDSRYGDKAPKLRMDDVLVRNYLEAEGDEAVEAARKALYQSIANQLPNTWVDKWNSWRYLAMLSSPRTHIRNTFGNAGFVAVRKTKDIVATLMEHGYEAVTGKQGERTKVIFHDKALLEAARADYPNVVDLLDGAGKYSQAIGEIEEMKPAFGDKGAGWKALSKAADFNTRLLTVEDRWFSKPAYIGALAGYLQAKGITAEQFQTDEAIQAEARGYAVKEAQRATYRDFNDFSDFLASIGRRTQNSQSTATKAAGILMEGVLPFRRTPANILVRAVDYSPIGLLRGVKQACVDVRAGEKTAAEAIDLLASGLTGTALVGLGALLFFKNFLTPPEDPDEKQAGFDDLQGKQAYSLHIGDRYYTVDWLAPEALPVFVGAEIGAYFQDRGERNGTALDAILRISEPMLEMSMLSSLNDLLDNLSYSDNKLLTILSSATFSYLTQCLPTVFGQAERVGETERETTFIDRDSRLNGDLQYVLASVANKTPGVEFQQIPYIDAWGRHEDTGNVAVRVLNNLFNPAYVSKEQSEPFEAELQRLYDLGYTGVLPQRVPQSTKVSGNNLTAEQYVTYAETKGTVQHDAIRDIVGSDWYSGMSDAVRDELISKAYDYAAAAAKLAVDENADVPQWVLDVMEAVKSGEELAGMLRERVDEGAVDFRTEYPEFSDLSNAAIGKYTEFCEGAGISARQFYDAYGACSEFTADKDENGESISGSKKQKVVDYILGLGLSREQERALWNAVKDKTWVDKDTPWA